MAANNGKRKPAFRRNTHNRMSMILIAVAVMAIIVVYLIQKANRESKA